MPTIHDTEFEEYLYLCVSIDRSDINSEFCRVSADLAYWGEALAQTDRALGEADLEAERISAELYTFFRDQLTAKAASKPKDKVRVTEKMVDMAVARSMKYRTSREHINDCKAAKRRVVGIIEAIKTKRDMLVSLGAQLRAEQQYEPRINEKRTT